ncbi:DHA2 family efflux MFS transporter permease subunit [Lentzea tibetensis]|uniref:DHA2 family efflux MFS transporter permease subunit n=1 Tax=Lentzea tibetensis TaxID=2591470 RepID=A0A563EMA3_9PSEU|nr:DHA2 family efflux MFS transporter permease subunit [Lentzea tibetensis]TWP48424.1 DHA2 family efflux MFS transporter permease subunit [Lentzea tibetensis]
MNRNPWLVLVALVLGQVATLLDTTVVNVAVPTLAADLGAGLDSVLWVINAYVLAFTVLLVTGGRLGDLFGQRRMFVLGVTLFTLASVVCGAAQSPGQLVAARVVQGIGAAMLVPQTLSLLTIVFPEEKRGAAFGVWGAVGGLGAAVGPTVGGLLVDTLGWRWIFYLNVPLGIAAAVLGLLWLPEHASNGRRRLDVLGTVLVTTGLFLLTYGLIEGERHGWDGTIQLVLVAGVLVLALFVLAERGRQDREPLLPFAVVRDRNFSLMAVVVAALPLGLGAMLFLTLLHLQSVAGLSARDAGLTIAVAPLLSAVVAPKSGAMIDRYGGKPVLMAGFALFAAGIVGIAFAVRADGQWWHLLPGLVVLGFGMGVGGSPAAIIAMRDVDQSMSGAASGLFNTTRLCGSLLGSAAVGALLQARLTAEGVHPDLLKSGVVPPALREGFADALRFAYLLPVAALVLGVLLTLGVRARESVVN